MDLPIPSLRLLGLAPLLLPALAGCGGDELAATPADSTHLSTPSTAEPSAGPPTGPSTGSGDRQSVAPRSVDQTLPEQNASIESGGLTPAAALTLPPASSHAGVYISAPPPPGQASKGALKLTVSIDAAGRIEGIIERYVASSRMTMTRIFDGQLARQDRTVTMHVNSVAGVPGYGTLELTLPRGGTPATAKFTNTDGRIVAFELTPAVAHTKLGEGKETFTMRTGVVQAGATQFYSEARALRTLTLSRDGAHETWRLRAESAELTLTADLTPTAGAGVYDATIHIDTPDAPLQPRTIQGRATLGVKSTKGKRRLLLSGRGTPANVLLIADGN